MSSSGIIYAVIVGAWAVYLVPMWLRRQDELNERHGTERFTTAIRVLSRRPSALARRYEAAITAEFALAGHHREPRESWTLIRRDRSRARERAERRERQRQERQERKRRRDEAALRGRPRSTLLARRRRVVSVLFLTFTAGSALTGVLGMGWVPVPAASGALLSFYIGHLRVQDRRRLEATLRRRVRATAAGRQDLGAQARDVAASAGRPPAPARSGPSAPRDPYDGEPPSSHEARDGWKPVPVPLPTYVTAPVAPRTTRAAGAGMQDARPAPERAAAEPASPPPARPAAQQPAKGAEGHDRTRNRDRDRRAGLDRTPLFDQYAVDSEPEHRLAAGE